MAFVLTKAEFYGREVDECLTNNFSQYVRFTITAANTDVDFDFGDYTGTFWDAVDATATGASALAALKDVVTRMKCFVALQGKGIVQYSQVRTGGTGLEYVLTLDSTSGLPNLAYVSGSAPTAYDIVLKVELKDNMDPVKVTYTA